MNLWLTDQENNFPDLNFVYRAFSREAKQLLKKLWKTDSKRRNEPHFIVMEGYHFIIEYFFTLKEYVSTYGLQKKNSNGS